MSLGVRLAATFAALVVLTSAAIGGAAYLATDRQVTGEVDDFLRERVEELTQGSRQRPSGNGDRNGRGNGRGDDAGAAAVAPGIALVVDPDSQVQVLDGDGDVTASSGLELPVNRRDRDIAEGEERTQLRTVRIDDTSWRIITRSLDGGGAVQVARSLSESMRILGALQSRLLTASALLAAVAAGAGWFVARRLTGPLRELTDTVGMVAATGDVDVPVEVGQGNDEVGQLAEGFASMLAALRTSREQQHQLVHDAAHELRTPLTSAMANVDWLSHASSLDEQTRVETLQSVRAELRELRTMINEIVDVATDQHELAPFTDVDLATVVRDSVARFGRRTHREVEVRAAPSTVHGDPDALARAVTNLLSNADKYSPAGGAVLVEVAGGKVTVHDTGEGIPAADRGRVFDRFHRRVQDRSKPGSGLGLAIVADVVAAHGGSVFVIDSVPLGGAAVGFELVASDLGAD